MDSNPAISDTIAANRAFLRCPDLAGAKRASDQEKGLPHPAHGKPAAHDIIELPPFDGMGDVPYAGLLDTRRSVRSYANEPITREQLGFILWSAQGVQAFRGQREEATLRPAPSGGARHPFELYAVVRNADGLEPGLYHYLPMLHVGEKRAALERVEGFNAGDNHVSAMLYEQNWTLRAAAILLFSCMPYRAEWRYAEAAHRVLLIDLGHAGQNVMLSAAALGLGSCCIAAYNQEQCDAALGLDGVDELTVYAVAVGNLSRTR